MKQTVKLRNFRGIQSVKLFQSFYKHLRAYRPPRLYKNDYIFLNFNYTNFYNGYYFIKFVTQYFFSVKLKSFNILACPILLAWLPNENFN